VANATLRPPYLKKDLLLIVQKAGWASGQVWTGAGSLACTGIRNPDRSARSESLYRLRRLGRQSVEDTGSEKRSLFLFALFLTIQSNFSVYFLLSFVTAFCRDDVSGSVSIARLLAITIQWNPAFYLSLSATR
jgi:hypothetical protein